MPGLSAKVFRTYNASWTMQEQLAKIANTGSVHDKYAAYNEANKKVAILCNHQRTVSTTHEQMMQRVEEKVCSDNLNELPALRLLIYPADQSTPIPETPLEETDPRPRARFKKEKA